MRTDENGKSCPATLGEYRDLCAALGGESCGAVLWLDVQIKKHDLGRDEEVVAPDSQMRMALMPRLSKRGVV